jgi:hypothetical protein
VESGAYGSLSTSLTVYTGFHECSDDSEVVGDTAASRLKIDHHASYI